MSHMTEQDRCKVENLLNAGASPRSIAQQLKRSHSTILRKHRRENEADQKRESAA